MFFIQLKNSLSINNFPFHQLIMRLINSMESSSTMLTFIIVRTSLAILGFIGGIVAVFVNVVVVRLV